MRRLGRAYDLCVVRAVAAEELCLVEPVGAERRPMRARHEPQRAVVDRLLTERLPSRDQILALERPEANIAMPAGRHYVHGPARVRPKPKLLPIHPELTAGDLAHFFIDTAQLELAHLKAQRRAAVAAAAGQMKHVGAVGRFELLDELLRAA